MIANTLHKHITYYFHLLNLNSILLLFLYILKISFRKKCLFLSLQVQFIGNQKNCLNCLLHCRGTHLSVYFVLTATYSPWHITQTRLLFDYTWNPTLIKELYKFSPSSLLYSLCNKYIKLTFNSWKEKCSSWSAIQIKLACFTCCTGFLLFWFQVPVYYSKAMEMV